MASNPKQQVSLIIFSTILAGFSLASILDFTEPASSSWITFTFFYLSLFLLILGLLTLLGLGIRQWIWPGHYVNNLGNSFRQAFLLAILITASFFLQAQRLMFWWVEASLILFFAVVEAFLNLKV